MAEFSGKRQALEGVALFQDIKGNAEAMAVLESLMESRKFPRGQVLIEQGAEGHEFFVLTSGQVSIFKKTAEGDPYKVALLKAEQHVAFGEGGLVDGEARSATVVCDTEVECLVLNRHHFDEYSKKYPQFALPILKRIALSLMGRLNQTSNDLMLLHKALMSEIRSS